MKNLDIKMNISVNNISVNNEGESIINDLKVTNNKILQLEDYVVQKSQPKDGRLNFKQATKFQDIIKDGREVIIYYNKRKYRGSNDKTRPGMINGLTQFFKDNNIVENDKLRIELLKDENPLKMNIEKR